MDKIDTETIESCFVLLSRDLDVGQIGPYLIEAGLLDTSSFVDMQRIISKSDRNYQFIEKIQCCGPEAFRVLLDALGKERGQKHLAQRLQEKKNHLQVPKLRRTVSYAPKMAVPTKTTEGSGRSEHDSQSRTKSIDATPSSVNDAMSITEQSYDPPFADIFSEEDMERYSKLPEHILCEFYQTEKHRIEERVKFRCLEANKINCKKRSKVLKVVMLGKTGSGKSALGNLILGHPGMFKENSKAETMFNEVEEKNVQLYRCELHVLDTPGFFDTKKSKEEILQELSKIPELFADGIHAFCFVFKATDHRFTEHEEEIFRIVKNLLGGAVLRFSVIALTHANSKFIKGMSLSSYVEKTDGKLGDIIKEVNSRIIAVESKCDSEYENRLQVKAVLDLFQKVQLDQNGEVYTNSLLKFAKTERKKFEQKQKDTLEEQTKRMEQEYDEAIYQVKEIADEKAETEIEKRIQTETSNVFPPQDDEVIFGNIVKDVKAEVDKTLCGKTSLIDEAVIKAIVEEVWITKCKDKTNKGSETLNQMENEDFVDLSDGFSTMFETNNRQSLEGRATSNMQLATKCFGSNIFKSVKTGSPSNPDPPRIISNTPQEILVRNGGDYQRDTSRDEKESIITVKKSKIHELSSELGEASKTYIRALMRKKHHTNFLTPSLDEINHKIRQNLSTEANRNFTNAQIGDFFDNLWHTEESFRDSLITETDRFIQQSGSSRNSPPTARHGKRYDETLGSSDMERSIQFELNTFKDNSSCTIS